MTINKPPHINVKIQGLVQLFEFNNPNEHYATAVAHVAMTIDQFQWHANTDNIGLVLNSLESYSSVLVHLNGSRFAVTPFRPHPHPQMATRGFEIATGNDLPSGGIVRVGAGNDLYSRLYGHAGRRLMATGQTALINGVVNLGFNLATGQVFAKLLGATGLLSTQDAGALWRAFTKARVANDGLKVSTGN